MFTPFQPANSWARRYRTVGVSVGAHLAALLWIVFHNPSEVTVSPSWLELGESSHSYRITYIPHGNDDSQMDASRALLPPLASKHRQRPKPQKLAPKPKEEPRTVEANAEAGDHNAHAGSPLGTVLDGPITGHEVRVALPVYPEPQVDRANLPRDLVGDVVIEVTIDAQGNVIDTKIVQAIGRGIDEKIEATIRRRHYQPATLDGTPVASRQDVHFHFPS